MSELQGLITGFNQAVKSIQEISQQVLAFLQVIQNTFIFLPSGFWILVLAAIALILLLRIVGR